MSFQRNGQGLKRLRFLSAALLVAPAICGVGPAVASAQIPAGSEIPAPTRGGSGQTTDLAADYPNIGKVRAVSQSVAEALGATLGDMQLATSSGSTAAGKSSQTVSQQYLLLPGFEDVSIRTEFLERAQDLRSGKYVNENTVHDAVTFAVVQAAGSAIRVEISSPRVSNPSLTTLIIPLSALNPN
ncbi:MAG: hypothetical protein V9E85_11005 [Candidatus Nanopelagicales bacterium]